MHQTPRSPERTLPPPVSLTSQSHQEKPPEVTCTSRGKPGFPGSTRERPRETFYGGREQHRAPAAGDIQHPRPVTQLRKLDQAAAIVGEDRKSTRLNSSHQLI